MGKKSYRSWSDRKARKKFEAELSTTATGKATSLFLLTPEQIAERERRGRWRPRPGYWRRTMELDPGLYGCCRSAEKGCYCLSERPEHRLYCPDWVPVIRMTAAQFRHLLDMPENFLDPSEESTNARNAES